MRRRAQPAALEKASPDLLSALVAAVADRAFSSCEVIAHAQVDASLRAALDLASLGNARKLGKFFRTIEGDLCGHAAQEDRR